MLIFILFGSIIYGLALLTCYEMYNNDIKTSYDTIIICLLCFIITPVVWIEYLWFSILLVFIGLLAIGIVLFKELLNKLK